MGAVARVIKNMGLDGLILVRPNRERWLEAIKMAPGAEEILEEAKIFHSVEQAISVFREGAAMAKGTTTLTGLVHSYYANIFGPAQYKKQHDRLAHELFDNAFKTGIFVGQLRTRLGIPGFETQGPQQASQALLKAISEKSCAQK